MSGNSIGQSIQRVGGSAGPGAYKGRLTAQTQAGFSPIKQRITSNSISTISKNSLRLE